MRQRKLFFMILVPLMALLMGLELIVADNANAADEVVKWRVQSHWPASSSSFTDSLQVLADRLKERTNGRLILEPYAAGSLVPAKETRSLTVLIAHPGPKLLSAGKTFSWCPSGKHASGCHSEESR